MDCITDSSFIFESKFIEDYSGCQWILPDEESCWIKDFETILNDNVIDIYNFYDAVLICGRPNLGGKSKLWAWSLDSFVQLFICLSLSLIVSKGYITRYSSSAMCRKSVFDRGKY